MRDLQYVGIIELRQALFDFFCHKLGIPNNEIHLLNLFKTIECFHSQGVGSNRIDFKLFVDSNNKAIPI